MAEKTKEKKEKIIVFISVNFDFKKVTKIIFYIKTSEVRLCWIWSNTRGSSKTFLSQVPKGIDIV